MKYLVIEPFTVQTSQSSFSLPIGRILELSEPQANRLGGKVRLADCKEPCAWLERGELRTTGVFPGGWPDGGLTPEIVRLTAGNPKLQESLLRLHIPAYSSPLWIETVRQWRERARHLFEVDGKELKEADEIAAREMHLLAFMNKLN